MRGKLFLGTALVAGVLAFGAFAPSASAHPPRGYGYYGLGLHDFVPHWHQYSTPYGSSWYYGRGWHDYVPHRHYHSHTPYREGHYYRHYGTYGHDSPYRYGHPSHYGDGSYRHHHRW